MSQSTDSARDAICHRAAALATEGSADDLVKLADAVSKVTHGPQGGAMSTEYNYKAETTTTTRYVDRGPGRPGFG